MGNELKAALFSLLLLLFFGSIFFTHREAPGAVSPPAPRCQAPKADGRYNVVIILLDATRPDHLGCYGYGGNTSGNIDAFASDGALFERAYAQAPWTVPSIASLFSGSYVRDHGVYKRFIEVDVNNRTEMEASVLDNSTTTLAEVFQRNGYATYAIGSNPVLDERFGFGQGFDGYYLNSGMRRNVLAGFRSALTDPSKLGDADRPFFAYIHLIDDHFPYNRAGDNSRCVFSFANRTIDALHDRSYNITEFNDYMRENPGLNSSGADVGCMVGLYDGCIRGTDATVGDILSLLRRRGLYERTVVVVMADHGEAFMEHRFLGHGNSLYEEQVRIPLIIRFPGVRGGVRVGEPVEAIDLDATFVDYLNLTTPAGFPPYGSSLAAAVADGGCRAQGGYVFAQMGPDDAAVISKRWKLIEEGGGKELYDLEADPAERVNLAGTEKDVLDRLERARSEFLSVKGGSKRHKGAVDVGNETIERLKSLGYVD